MEDGRMLGDVGARAGRLPFRRAGGAVFSPGARCVFVAWRRERRREVRQREKGKSQRPAEQRAEPWVPREPSSAPRWHSAQLSDVPAGLEGRRSVLLPKTEPGKWKVERERLGMDTRKGCPKADPKPSYQHPSWNRISQWRLMERSCCNEKLIELVGL